MSSSNLSKATTKAQCKSTSDLASINVNSPSLESNNQHSPKIPCADQTNQNNQNAKLPPTLHKLLQPFSPSSIHEGSTGVEANSSNSLKPSHATSEECSSKGFSLKKIKSDFKNLFNHGKHSSQNVKNHNNSRSPSDVIQEDWVEIDKNLSDENKPDLKKDGNFHCHTIGASTGSHLRDLIKQEEKSGILDVNGGLREKPQTLKQTSLESDQIKRNCSSTGNFQALGGSQATTPTNSAQSNPNNSPQPTNYNLKAAAINLKILPSNQPSNYYIDSETHADIQKKLSYLTPIERIELQRVSYNLLKNNYEIKNSYAVSLEEDIKELNQKLLERNETIRSQFEIDNLRNEIRNLTNEKAELEIEISKRADWKCSKCTYDNKSQDVICRMCETERDEIYICKNCNTRNPIINLKCTNCSANLGAENQENRLHASASEGHYQQSSPHLNPHQYKTQSSTTSTGSSGGSATSLSNNHNYSHNQHSHHYQQQYSNQPNIGGRSRNASSTSLNNQNAVDSLGSNPNLSQPKTSHRPPPPPPPIPQYQHQSQQQQHHIPVAGSTRPIHHPQISSAPILGLPTIPFVPGYGVVAPPMTPQPPQGGRSPLIFHNNSSHSSPNFGATPR